MSASWRRFIGTTAWPATDGLLQALSAGLVVADDDGRWREAKRAAKAVERAAPPQRGRARAFLPGERASFRALPGVSGGRYTEALPDVGDASVAEDLSQDAELAASLDVRRAS